MDGNGEGAARKARVLGINHVVLEVGDLDAALEFYGAVFDFTLRGKSDHNAFIGMGDQFIQLTLNTRDGGPDTKRHFGLVVDDREGVAEALEAAGAERVGERLNFRDPWGNRIEVVPYAGIQFTKADHVMKGMGVGPIEKTEEALKELAEAGMAPDGS
ncbi:MAG: VOC family protein [Alphaproteobacteria bacterium]|nr:VOC family protein [Alphaproteobacteria bacterium]